MPHENHQGAPALRVLSRKPEGHRTEAGQRAILLSAERFLELGGRPVAPDEMRRHRKQRGLRRHSGERGRSNRRRYGTLTRTYFRVNSNS